MTTRHSQKNPTPFPTSQDHDKPEGVPKAVPKKPGEGALDEGIAESFPASDPVSVNVTKVVKKPKEGGAGESEKTDAGGAGGSKR